MVEDNLRRIYKELPPEVKLVAVSKFHPCEDILEAYRAGQRRFGENRPQEFAAKAVQLPEDIEWHFIGHLQTNKLKMVLPYASLVESIDSRHLLDAVEKWGSEHGKVIDVLLELHLGAEETKGGFTEAEIEEILTPVPERRAELVEGVDGAYPHIRFRGLMGMATNTDDEAAVEADFVRIEAFKKHLDDRFALPDFTELSIGMSHDWPLAVRHGATIVRIGTAIFGPRIYR
jgi:pyridoxal phosphate enzyme, YggS family